MNLEIKAQLALTARIAPYVAEITTAREVGHTWPAIADAIADALGIERNDAAAKRVRQAYARAKHAIKKGRLKPTAAGSGRPHKAAAPTHNADDDNEPLPPFGQYDGTFKRLG